MFKNKKHSCLPSLSEIRFPFSPLLGIIHMARIKTDKMFKYKRERRFDCLSKAHLAHNKSRNWIPFHHWFPIVQSPLPTQPDLKQSLTLDMSLMQQHLSNPV